MKKLGTLFCICLFSLQFVSAQYLLKEGFLDLAKADNRTMTLTYKNLAIYPILAGEQFLDAHKDIEKFTSLQEALAKQKIVITETVADSEVDSPQDTFPQIQRYNSELPAVRTQEEIQQQRINQNAQLGVGEGAQVNKLYLENVSNDTIFIMAGEVVQGGKQDRVLASDLVLPPNSGKVDISVFCVEHGRWSPGGEEDNFNTYFTVTSNKVRAKATKEQNQSAVWDEVDRVTKANMAGSATGTYAALKDSKSFKKNNEAYQEFFHSAFKELDNCIGFVGVTGDRIIGADLFATPELFQQQSTNLINAYITDAITEGGKVTVKEKEVVSYLESFFSNSQTQEQAIEAKGVQYEWRSKKLHINTY
ncbi:MAG: DUF6569 family protein [Bacteroidota bacterium]